MSVFDGNVFDLGAFDVGGVAPPSFVPERQSGAHGRKKKTRGRELSEFLAFMALSAGREAEPQAPEAPPKRKPIVVPAATIAKFEAVRPALQLPVVRDFNAILREQGEAEARRRALAAMEAAIRQQEEDDEEEAFLLMVA